MNDSELLVWMLANDLGRLPKPAQLPRFALDTTRPSAKLPESKSK